MKWLGLCVPVSSSSLWKAVVWELWGAHGNKSATWEWKCQWLGQRFVWGSELLRLLWYQ